MVSFNFSRSWFGLALVVVVLSLILVLPAAAVTLNPGDATASSATISNGDSVFINGVATGHPQQGLQVWVLGPNYVKVSTVSVNSDNSYSFQLRAADTQNLASGQYVVLIQHPMMNGRFDITYDTATGRVTNQQTGAGLSILQLTGSGGLQTPDAALALMEAIGSQNIDDTFATASFTIRSPNAFVDPVGDHAVGDKITLGGSTNLAVGDDLSVTVLSSSFGPTKKSESGEFSGASGVVKVVAGNGNLNRWTFDVDTSTWKPDEYIVTVSGVTVTVTGSSTFSLLARAPATIATTIPPTTVITTVAPQTSAPATTVPVSQPPVTKSPIPVIGVISLLGCLVIVRQIGSKK